ncbi:MAG: nitrophenyl compound nitroreductase subunit ArsF family protein, partial [Bacteroidota bacterium]
MRKKIFPKVLMLIAVVAFISSCKSGNQNQNSTSKTDSTNVEQKDTSTVSNPDTTKGADNTKPKADLSIVKIYNFHVTNRCVSCIAIEDATTKTLKTYFSAEMKQGRIKRQILNVDDEANSAIAEKYQAFGSGLFVTRVF